MKAALQFLLSQIAAYHTDPALASAAKVHIANLIDDAATAPAAQGPQGEVGPTGPTGPTGPQGPQGIPGKPAEVNIAVAVAEVIKQLDARQAAIVPPKSA